MNAAIFDCFFNCFRNSICLLTAFDGNYVNKTLDKIWNGITFTDDNTDGGMLKLRQVVNTATKKRSTYYKVVNGQKIETGFGSLIEGIIVEKDRKMRGDRVSFLFLEEAGSNPILETSFVKAEELCTVGGNKIGIIAAAGTGGDSGPNLAGLSKVFYNPNSFLILPFYNNYNDLGEWRETSYFLPAYITMNKAEYVGSRGEYLIEKLKEYYLNRRANITDPQTLLKHKCELCFTPEEAFSAEGVNKFNKLKIADQITKIMILKLKPKIVDGYMQFTYKGPGRSRSDISGVRFIPKVGGPVHILQEPLWEMNQDIEPGETEELRRERLAAEENQEKITSKISNLYVAGIDGIDIGMAETSEQTRDPSKFCTVIKRRIYGMKEPMYVAYYLDRPNDIREAYKLTIGLLMWYNCQANLEATRMSILTYARDNKFMLYFMRRPRVCFGDINNRKRTNMLYGTTATIAMIDHLTDLISTLVEDYCHNIWFLEFLELLNKYTDENKGKFDIVAALGMCEIADEELSDVLPRRTEPVSTGFQDIGYYKDSKGYTRFGVIPKPINIEVRGQIDTGYQEGYNITSNPRYR